MKKSSKAHIRLGRRGEDAAARYLTGKGFEILGRNLLLKSAEIDILARDGATFVLVEVKTLRYRKDVEQRPGMHYTEDQRRRQRRAVSELQRKFADADFPFRHDLVEVFMGKLFPVAIRHHSDYYKYKHFPA